MKTTLKPHKRFSLRAGFSLVELLVVIAVIGIIAAIAIPNIGGITGSATTAKAQRNAQNLASVVSAARAAGATDTDATVGALVDKAVAGTWTFPSGSSYTGATFKVPNLSDGEQTAAEAYLRVQGSGANATLEYSTAAATPAP